MTMDMKIPLTKLYEKVSGRGNRYFTGRLGNARIVMFQDTQAEGSDPVWQVYLSDVPQTAQSQQAQQGYRAPPQQARQTRQEPAQPPAPPQVEERAPRRPRRASSRPQQAARDEWQNWQAPIDDMNDPLPSDMLPPQ